MPAKTLNQTLAANLDRAMTRLGISANALGAKAGVSPRTIANYLAPADTATQPSSGKERSAKLAEVQLIAEALGVHPIVLLTDPDERFDLAHALMGAIAADKQDRPQESGAAALPAPRKRANGR